MTHNEERAHWIKEGAIGLGGKFIQYLSVELDVKYCCQPRLDKECYCYPFPTINTRPHAHADDAHKMFHEMVQSLPFYLTSYYVNKELNHWQCMKTNTLSLTPFSTEVPA